MNVHIAGTFNVHAAGTLIPAIYHFTPQTYVSDCIGVHWIGFVDASFAVMVAITSLAGGKLVKIVPTYVLVAAAAIVHGGVVFFLLFWERSPSFVIVFAVAGAWGAGDGVWSTQMIGNVHENLRMLNLDSCTMNHMHSGIPIC